MLGSLVLTKQKEKSELKLVTQITDCNASGRDGMVCSFRGHVWNGPRPKQVMQGGVGQK
jgi:hypothetical protein